MKNTKIAARYAKALLGLALESQILDEVNNDMLLIADTIRNSRELSIVINSPIINADKKVAILNEIFKANIHELTLKFIVLIATKNRETFIDEIAEQFNASFKKHKNITTANVTSAVKISDELRAKIELSIANSTNTKVELIEKINPELIGGFVLNFDNQQYDASILKDIKDLKREFNINQYVSKFN